MTVARDISPMTVNLCSGCPVNPVIGTPMSNASFDPDSEPLLRPAVRPGLGVGGASHSPNLSPGRLALHQVEPVPAEPAGLVDDRALRAALRYLNIGGDRVG